MTELFSQIEISTECDLLKFSYVSGKQQKFLAEKKIMMNILHLDCTLSPLPVLMRWTLWPSSVQFKTVKDFEIKISSFKNIEWFTEVLQRRGNYCNDAIKSTKRFIIHSQESREICNKFRMTVDESTKFYRFSFTISYKIPAMNFPPYQYSPFSRIKCEHKERAWIGSLPDELKLVPVSLKLWTTGYILMIT